MAAPGTEYMLSEATVTAVIISAGIKSTELSHGKLTFDTVVKCQ